MTFWVEESGSSARRTHVIHGDRRPQPTNVKASRGRLLLTGAKSWKIQGRSGKKRLSYWDKRASLISNLRHI